MMFLSDERRRVTVIPIAGLVGAPAPEPLRHGSGESLRRRAPAR